MRLGISTAAFYGPLETEDAAGYIATLPLDCAEVFLQTFSEYDSAFAQDVRARLGSMPVFGVHPLGTYFENGMFSQSARQRRDAMDIFCRVLDAGATLGAAFYVYHGRYNPREDLLAWDAQRNADVLGPMCEEAAKRGMLVAWENVSWCQLTDESRIAQAVAMLPQVRFTLDIKQAMRTGCDPFSLAKTMGDRLVNVHVCDWDAAGNLCLPGEGCFDFKAFLDMLHGMGYAGPVILEPYASLIQNERALGRSIAFLRERIPPKNSPKCLQMGF